jgi:hypothetical protein
MQYILAPDTQQHRSEAPDNQTAEQQAIVHN